MKNILAILFLTFCLALCAKASNGVYVQNKMTAEKEIFAANTDVNTTKTNVSNDLKIAYEQETDTPAITAGIFGISWENISFALLSIIEVIVRIIPSAKDNSILNSITRFINNLVPNLRKDGGTF